MDPPERQLTNSSPPRARDALITGEDGAITDPGGFTVEEGVESLGMGRFQYLVLTMAGLCWTADAMEMLLISFIKSPVQCEFNLSDIEAAFVTTSVGVGMLFGALVWGIFADARGRRVAFIAATAVTALFGLVSAVAPSFWTLLVARGIVGFGIGGVPIAFSLIMEFLPSKSRGVWGMGLAIFWSLGALFEAGVAMAVMPVLGWRWLIAISTLPLICLLVFSPLLVPESPRWLAAQGRFDDARAILERAARANGKSLPSGALVPEIKPNEPEEPAPLPHATQSRKKRFPQLAALMKPGVRSISIQIWIIWFVSAFVYYGAVFLQPDMLAAENAGRHCTYARTMCKAQKTPDLCHKTNICSYQSLSKTCIPIGIMHLQQAKLANSTSAALAPNPACAAELKRSDYINTLFATTGELPGTLATLALIDVLGRRPLLGYLFGIAAFAMLILLPCPGRFVETSAFFLSRAASNGFFQAAFLYTNEIYPSSVRATGMGTASAMARVGLITTPMVAQLLDNINFTLAIAIYAGALIVAVVTVGLMPIETTRRPLLSTTDELVAMLDSKRIEEDNFVPFSRDPSVHPFVRLFRWPARIEGRGRPLTYSSTTT